MNLVGSCPAKRSLRGQKIALDQRPVTGAFTSFLWTLRRACWWEEELASANG